VSGTTVARFTARGKVSRSRRANPLKLKAAKFTVAQGKTGAVRLALPKAAGRELRRARKLKVKLALAQKGTTPVVKTVTVTVPGKKKR
jgi:hypothetical protein